MPVGCLKLFKIVLLTLTVIILGIFVLAPVAVAIPYAIQKYFRARRWSSASAWGLSILKYSSIGVCIDSSLGAVAPMLLFPGSNQAPLFGLLVSLPIGFLIGAAFGSFFGIDKRVTEYNNRG